MPRQHIEVGPPVHGTANDGVKPRGLGLVLPCHHVPHFSTLLAVHALSVCCKLACRRATSSPMLPAVSSLLAAADAIGLDSVLARISSAAPCLSMVSVGAPFGNMSGCSNIQGSAEGGVCGSECSREAERLWSQDSCGPRPLSTCKLLWVDTPSTALPESDHCALARLRLRMSVVSRVPLSIPCTSSFARSSAARSFFAASRSRGLICRTLEVSRVTSAQFPPSTTYSLPSALAAGSRMLEGMDIKLLTSVASRMRVDSRCNWERVRVASATVRSNRLMCGSIMGCCNSPLAEGRFVGMRCSISPRPTRRSNEKLEDSDGGVPSQICFVSPNSESAWNGSCRRQHSNMTHPSDHTSDLVLYPCPRRHSGLM
eukprot:m.147901 g.147901  ORF g.147901 m.147901 type:complete len:371 (+) comp17786_c0_seq42:1112-2224(+)